MAEKAVHRNVSLGVASELILGRNTYRRHALLVNDSDAVIYLNLGSTAVANEGIRVNASGGSYEINLDNAYFGEVHAVATGAAKKLMVTEVSNA